MNSATASGFFTASMQVAESLVGLLFVAVSLRPESVMADKRQRAVANGEVCIRPGPKRGFHLPAELSWLEPVRQMPMAGLSLRPWVSPSTPCSSALSASLR